VVSTNPSEKYEESSVGMMKFPIYGKIKFMFQTTKHPVYFRGYCGGLVKISMQRGIL
jgi:hypothetical protein